MSDSPFSTANLRREVEKAMNEIPPEHGFAKLQVTAPDGAVTFLMAARLDDHWMIQGEATFKIPTRAWGTKVEVLRSW